MLQIKFKIREDGLYVENPQKEAKFVSELKQSLNDIGIGDFNEEKFLVSLDKCRTDIVKVSDILPSKYDASISFKLNTSEPEKVTATVVPPKSGKSLSKADILISLDEDGYEDVTPDLQAIDQAIEKQDKTDKPYTFNVGIRIMPQIEVKVQKNNMEAVITITKPERCRRICEQDILSALNAAGVSKGIKLDQVRQIAEKNENCTAVLVAAGAEAIDGEDGQIIFNFDAKGEKLGPQIDERGNADFHHLGMFESVKEGFELCEVTEPTKGISGYDVFGQEVMPKSGKRPDLPAGVNTRPDHNNPRVLVSSIPGIPKLSDGKIIINPVLDIKGDVGLKTGDVNFIGDVNVSGTISDGFKVEAKGDVIINDTCESVKIESDGDVILRRGVRSDENAYIKAGRDVVAKFVEGVRVEAGNNVNIQEYCYHSIINAGNMVSVYGKKGYIAGGRISARNHVITKRLGNPLATRTEVFVSAIDSCDDLALNETQTKQLQKLLEMLDEVLDVLEKTQLSDNDQDTKKNEAIKNEYESKKIELVKRIKKLDPGFIEPDSQSVKYVAVTETVHPNVLIRIRDCQYMTKEEMKAVRFLVIKREMVIEPFHLDRGSIS
jgi:uncharacterized protein (DUF342 family)